ncbi:MAG: hypothetical protein MUC42_03975, partial [Bryobacter sp.]|nr:hypothetical protein [Bryobacter sp.]
MRKIILLAALSALAPALLLAQTPQQFGGNFDGLAPAQKGLVRKWAEEYQKIYQQPLDPKKFYDKLPFSTRTTFEAVTHALSRSALTSGSGKPYGTALDLIEMVERVAGNVPGARGDSQFRIYVYLKPGAVDKLYNSREFKRERDNTVYHIGFPINFRQQGGVPSIQFSIARTGRRADIDVDYRPSGGVQALTSGHLTAANSDVRAGNNHQRHVARWEGFLEWWRDLLAALKGDTALPETADFTPETDPDFEKKIRGPLPEAIHAYLKAWLLNQQPYGLLTAVSIRAFPCVAELSNGARPDSKLALTRMLRRMQEINRLLGPVTNLEKAILPVAYPLPESQPVQHEYQNLFAIQRVHEDVAWAMDCRIRYGLRLVEAIPRPEHKIEDSYVVSYRIKAPGAAPFWVQTWRKEAGVWKLTAFDIKRKTLTPPPDLLTKAANPPNAKLAPEHLESAVESFLKTWLSDHKFAEAAAAFLPESYACDALAESGTPAA